MSVVLQAIGKALGLIVMNLTVILEYLAKLTGAVIFLEESQQIQN
jgi:hypothetical protein